MAYGVKTPPLGEWIFNLGEAAEYMFDHTIFQDNLVFVDFCEQMVKETNPSVLEKAEKSRGARTPTSTATGRSPTSCAAFNPFTGEIYKEALLMSRVTREMFCLMEGRHVHPSTIYPGGVGTVATPQLFTDYLVRLLRFLDFVKKAVADERRRLRLLLRGAARLRGGRPAADPARLLGRVQQPRPRRLRLPQHGATGATRCT